MLAGRDPNGCERCDAPRPLDARGLCDRCADIVDRRELQARVDDARERQAQRDHAVAHEAAAVADPQIRPDGGEPSDQPHADDTDMTDDTDIQTGDVALDRTQGRPVHVIEDTGLTALDWSNENGYDLLENYGNSRCGTAANDRVFEVVYCSSIQSEPSKTYAMPESRLDRVETEKADGGRKVYGRIAVDVLEALLARAGEDDEQAMAVLEDYAQDVGLGDAADEARELVDAERLIGGDE